MIVEPQNIGARLLQAEPASSARRRRLEQEITHMFDGTLSRRGRLYWAIALVSALAFTGLGTASLLSPGAAGMVRAIWWIYTLANSGSALFAARVLQTDRINVERLMAIGKASPALTLIITLLLLIRALSDPTNEATLWVLVGLIALLLSLVIVLYNRIVAAELRQREQTLLLRLRIEELVERLGGDDEDGLSGSWVPRPGTPSRG